MGKDNKNDTNIDFDFREYLKTKVGDLLKK